MSKVDIEINDFVCFALYSTSRYMTLLYKKYLNELDLTYPQFLVLLLLWESDHQTVNSIGAKLYLDTGTLTPLLKRLEGKKILTRNRSKEDERSVIISLTKSGKKLKENFPNIAKGMLCDIGLTMEETKLLSKKILKVRDHIISSLD